MTDLRLWLAGWPAAPALLLLPLAVDDEGSPARAAWAVAALVALLLAPPDIVLGALVGGAAGLVLARVPGWEGTALAMTAAGLGSLTGTGSVGGGTPIELTVSGAITGAAGLWCFAAATAERRLAQGAWTQGALLLLALLVSVDLAGRSYAVSAGAALCILGGGVFVWLRRWLDAPVWAAACAPLAVGLLRPPTASGPYDHPPDLPVRVASRLDVVVRDGAMISSLAALSDGTIAYGEFASGRVFLLEPESGRSRLLAQIPLPVVRGSRDSYELGLWGLAAHPDGSSIFAMAVHRWDEGATDPAARSSRIVRIDLVDGTVRSVVEGIPAGPIHAGGALLFDGDGVLHASVGDGLVHGTLGEEPVSAPGAGVILSLQPGAEPRVVARGFRNVYGMAWADDGALWVTENGPDCCDALHRVQPGGFHGWPPGVERDAVEPVWQSGRQRIGPTGLAKLSSRYGEFAGDLVFGTWHTGALHRVRVDGERVLEHEIITRIPLASPGDGPYPFAGAFTGLSTAPDGTLWFSTLNAVGRVLSLEER